MCECLLVVGVVCCGVLFAVCCLTRVPWWLLCVAWYVSFEVRCILQLRVAVVCWRCFVFAVCYFSGVVHCVCFEVCCSL